MSREQRSPRRRVEASAQPLPPPPRTREPAGSGPHLPLQVGLEGLGLVEQSDAALPSVREARASAAAGGASRPPGASGYLMWVAGRDSSCLERNSSRCLSWCLSFSGRSTISGFSTSSSTSPEGQRHTLGPLDKGPPAGFTDTTPCWTQGDGRGGPRRAPADMLVPVRPLQPSHPTGPKALEPRASEQEGALRFRWPRKQRAGGGEQESRCYTSRRAETPRPGPKAHRTPCLEPPGPSEPSCRAQAPPRAASWQGTQGRACRRPAHRRQDPLAEGGSYLPRRCRPPVRFYSRLTGLYNRQTASRRRVSCPLPARPGPRAAKLGGRVDKGAADHPAETREHLGLWTAQPARLGPPPTPTPCCLRLCEPGWHPLPPCT